MSTEPDQQNQNNDPLSALNNRAPETPCESVVLPPAKLILLGELLRAAPQGLEPADLAVFSQEVAPLLHASIPDQVVANFCEAARPFLARGSPVATTLKLCASLLEHEPPLDLLSQDMFAEILKAHSALLCAPAAVAERRAVLPYASAMALMRPGLAGRHAVQSVRALGEILLSAPCGEPTGADCHRILRDLDPLLGANAQFEDLSCLAALLRNEDASGGSQGLSYQAFCSIVPALRAESRSSWGELRAATRAAMKVGFPNAWHLLPSYATLRRGGCSSAVQQSFLLAMGEIARDSSTQGDLPKLAADLAFLWGALPPPDRACRDLAGTIAQGGTRGLLQRLMRVTARGFERGEPEMQHFSAFEDLAAETQSFSGLGPIPANVVRRIALLRSITDLSASFSSALAFDMKRLPGQVFSPLVRSALALGELQLVHSEEFRGFPGHGVLITNFLRTPASAPSSGPFSNLQNRSPLFAAKLSALPNVKLLCTPGLMVFSPPPEMNLGLQGRLDRHFSLVVYSQDHRHPSLIQSLLVDSAWLWEQIAPCLKEWSPNWGVGLVQHPAIDIQDVGLRPEQILEQTRAGNPVALDIASPTVLLQGFASALTPPCGDAPRESLGREIGRYLTETLDLLMAWRIGMAHVHKGLADVPALALGRSRESGEASSSAVTPDLDPRLTPLVDLLAMHGALVASGGAALATDPMLVSANVRNYPEAYDGDLVIDIRTLEAKKHGLPQRLFERGAPLLTPTVQRHWLREILPSLEIDPLQDLRFVERRELPRC